MSLIKFTFFLIVMIMLTACSELRMHIDSAEYLNAGDRNQSLPVFVKVYQLDDDSRFNHASFRQLWKNDASVLGSSLLAKKEFVISPGNKTKIKLKIAEGTSHIAVLAVFRKPQGDEWRIIEEIPTFVWAKTLNIALEGNRLIVVN